MLQIATSKSINSEKLKINMKLNFISFLTSRQKFKRPPEMATVWRKHAEIYGICQGILLNKQAIDKINKDLYEIEEKFRSRISEGTVDEHVSKCLELLKESNETLIKAKQSNKRALKNFVKFLSEAEEE